MALVTKERLCKSHENLKNCLYVGNVGVVVLFNTWLNYKEPKLGHAFMCQMLQQKKLYFVGVDEALDGILHHFLAQEFRVECVCRGGGSNMQKSRFALLSSMQIEMWPSSQLSIFWLLHDVFVNLYDSIFL